MPYYSWHLCQGFPPSLLVARSFPLPLELFIDLFHQKPELKGLGVCLTLISAKKNFLYAFQEKLRVRERKKGNMEHDVPKNMNWAMVSVSFNSIWIQPTNTH
jgi:hypothetical protein